MFSMMGFLLTSTKVNTFGESQFAGVCITTLASFLNLGNNAWLQQTVTSYFGYNYSVMGGLVVTAVICLFFGKIGDWVEKG